METPLFTNTPEGREAFKQLAQKVVDWLVDYYAQMESLPVRSQVSPGDIYASFENSMPAAPVSDETVFQILNDVILPGITNWQHPNFYAYFPSNTSFPSIAGEMLAAGISAQCMMWETSPAATELEQRCMEWCRDMLGLPSYWEGAIQDTASTATLTALLTAREWKSGFRVSKHGYDGTVYRIYASTQAHSSVEKAVRLAGFGTDNLVKVDVDESLALHPDKLEQFIQQDIRNGFIPTAIISTLGTTGTGAVDPIGRISEIAANYGLWHHVDAAYAGTALLLEEYQSLGDGLEGADSFVVNPHKWMFVQFDCSMYYVRDPELLLRTMSINPSYLITEHGDHVNDYRDWGIPMGRRFRALKFWMTMMLLGTDNIKTRIRHHIRLAQMVEQFLEEHALLERVYPRSLNILTFRVKSILDPDGHLTRQLVSRINAGGKAYFTHATVEKKSLIRWVTGQAYTEERHIRHTFEVVNDVLQHLITPG